MAMDESRMASIAEQITREILQDIDDGIVPPDVNSFSALHDYVDANTYGGFCDEGGPNEVGVYVTHDDIDNIQERVHQWLTNDQG